MLKITQAKKSEYTEIRNFYYELIDTMQTSEYQPAWKKGIYPDDDYLLDAVENNTMYIGRTDEKIAAAMVVNCHCNQGYDKVKWSVKASRDEISVIHILGVLPVYSGKGYAKEMVKEALNTAKSKGSKAVRLDVLAGNIPAERLYRAMGFKHIATVPMFYEDTGWTDFLLYEYVLDKTSKI